MEITNPSRLAQGLSSLHCCLCIQSVNQSLEQLVSLLSLIFQPYIAFSIQQFPPNLARLSPQDLWRSGFIGWGLLQVDSEKVWEGQEEGHIDLFSVEMEEWAAYSTGIFFNCAQ